MIGHIHRLANDLSILKQSELNHDHFSFVVSLVGAGSCDVFQSYGSILQAALSGGRGFRRFNVPRLSTNSVRLMWPIFLKEP